MTKFKQFERYPTRNGGTAVILHSVGNTVYAAAYDSRGVYEATRTYDACGQYLYVDSQQYDIIPPEPDKLTGWVNVYREDDGSLHSGSVHTTRKQAMSCVRGGFYGDRVGCHRITIRAEFEDDD
jgi:hypothetical protein